MQLSFKMRQRLAIAIIAQIILATLAAQGSQRIVVDHTSTDIYRIPTNWIKQAKQTLHIAYGHTSHGNQVIEGMTGLVAFMNGKDYPANLFAWNTGGTNDALDLRDTPFGGWYDLGDPDWNTWEVVTRSYLSTNPECNVVMWAWCEEVTTATASDIANYLALMDGLERDFTNVTFVYMTARLDTSGAAGNLNMRNNQIRDYCLSEGKVLYDFADIESYDPDGATNYMLLYANDGCWYGVTGSENWALDWQSNHIEGVDWYDCPSDHSQPLNANRKAYAAWWLWASLAGWNGTQPEPPMIEFNPAPTAQAIFTFYEPQNFPSDKFLLESSQDLLAWKAVTTNQFSSVVHAVSNNWQRVDFQATGWSPTNNSFFRLRWVGP